MVSSPVFFKKIDLHGEATDLLLESLSILSFVLFAIFFALEQALCPIDEFLLPLAHLQRVDAVLAGQLVESLVFLQCF